MRLNFLILKYPSLYEITVIVDDVLFKVLAWQNIKLANLWFPSPNIFFQMSLICDSQILETTRLTDR